MRSRDAPCWRPPGQYVWDTWFAQVQGRLHAFFLQASREACGGDPERRHDLSSIGHVVRSPRGFEPCGPQPALQAAPAPAWDDLALWTGSVVEAAPFSPFALFYTARGRADTPVATPHERQRPQQIGVAYSDDLVAWRRSPRSARGPVIGNPGAAAGLDGVAWRDPYVLREGACFHAFICARLAPHEATEDAGGALVHVAGASPEEWGEPRVLVASLDFYQMEVPQVFWRRSARSQRFYLLFSAQTQDCSARRRGRLPTQECRTGTYWMASEELPLGFPGFPPLRESARLLAPGLYSGKLVNPETEETPLLFGFPWPSPGEPFVGGICERGRLRFRPSGELEMIVPEATAAR